MLVAASIFTKQRRGIVERWAREGGLPPVAGMVVSNLLTTGPVATPDGLVLQGLRDDYRLPQNGELVAACLSDPAEAGGMVVLDWGPPDLVWQSAWDNLIYAPAGFCFADGSVYVSDLLGCSVFRIGVESDTGLPLARVSHPYMNDLHGLERTSHGLLVVCSGTDLIIEIDLAGRLLWQWWAGDHGFTAGPAGVPHENRRGREHRDKFYHTRYQSTHVNTAIIEDPAERFVLALLFHQGQLVRIDRAKSPDCQEAEIVLNGLARPHGLERTKDGWILCSSAACEVIYLDQDLRVKNRVRLNAGWLQDCTMLSNGGVLLNDVDNHSLIEVEARGAVVKRWEYPAEWRIDEILQVPAEYERPFLDAGQGADREQGAG